MLNYFYKNTIENFLTSSVEEIMGTITMTNQFDSTLLQNKSWVIQIPILKKALQGFHGTVFFEFSIPRMGKRVDVLLIIEQVVFVIEFKVGERNYHREYVEQVWDYALDLKNFHKPSHHVWIAPVLLVTEAKSTPYTILTTHHNDQLFKPVFATNDSLGEIIRNVLLFADHSNPVDSYAFEMGAYTPTPTIIEAATALYNSHSVDEITRSDASAKNLSLTTSAIATIIEDSKRNQTKSICFVTGVPGAGKTLVGLKVATMHLDKEKGSTSVYLSGNGPLVAILQEALARDKVKREEEHKRKITKKEAKQAVKAFIQIIHHYRDAYVVNKEAPYDHVAIFDEAQRAWDKEQTVKFMRMKKNLPDFDHSEPEFLISCLDRHTDWAVVICLVGGGQEINTGESGISEWLEAIYHRYPTWEVFISPHLSDSEYSAVDSIHKLQQECTVKFNEDLHLAVSMRSFRAENLSALVKYILDLDISRAKEILNIIRDKYPIVITRDLNKAKCWLKEKARGSERYGMIVSSQA